jgi:hypothetical protein
MEDPIGDGNMVSLNEPLYAVQLVRQVNYGALESRRYFIVVKGKDEPFLEVSERELIEANFQKLNSWVLPLASTLKPLMLISGTKTSSVLSTTSSLR